MRKLNHREFGYLVKGSRLGRGWGEIQVQAWPQRLNSPTWQDPTALSFRGLSPRSLPPQQDQEVINLCLSIGLYFRCPDWNGPGTWNVGGLLSFSQTMPGGKSTSLITEFTLYNSPSGGICGSSPAPVVGWKTHRNFCHWERYRGEKEGEQEPFFLPWVY